MRRQHTFPNHGLPAAYRELRWITSYQHTAAFKVTYTLGESSGFVLRYHSYRGEETNTGFNGICGMYRSSGYIDQAIGRSASTASSWAIERITGYNSSNVIVNFDLKPISGGPYIQECSLRNGVATACDGTTQSNYKWCKNSTYTTNASMGIFAEYNLSSNSYLIGTNRGSCTIAYFALYTGSTMNYEFIPCKRRSDGKVGMYDKVGNTFYPSATGTDFVAGPMI